MDTKLLPNKELMVLFDFVKYNPVWQQTISREATGGGLSHTQSFFPWSNSSGPISRFADMIRNGTSRKNYYADSRRPGYAVGYSRYGDSSNYRDSNMSATKYADKYLKEYRPSEVENSVCYVDGKERQLRLSKRRGGTSSETRWTSNIKNPENPCLT